MGDTSSKFEDLPLTGSECQLEFLHGFDGKYVENERKTLKINKNWDQRLGTVKDSSGDLLFHLRKDPLSSAEETEIRDQADNLIAACERVYRTKDGYITVMENGQKMCVASLTQLHGQKDDTLFLYIHSPRISVEDAKVTKYEKLQPALYIEKNTEGFDILAGDIKTNPSKLAQVAFSPTSMSQEEMKKKMRQGGMVRETLMGQGHFYLHVGRNVDSAFLVLVAHLVEEMYSVNQAKDGFHPL